MFQRPHRRKSAFYNSNRALLKCDFPGILQVRYLTTMTRLSGVLALLLCWLALPAQAFQPDRPVEAMILPGWRQADGTHVAALALRLAPGWKPYWRAPGDAGIPPEFNWSGSQNLSAVEVRYPVPHVFDQNGMRSVGYKGGVVLPLLIRPEDPAGDIQLRGEVSLGVCADICIPVTFRLRADLTPGGSPDAMVVRALRDQPREAGPMACTTEPIKDGLKVTLDTRLPPVAGDEYAVVETGNPAIWVSETRLTRHGDRLHAEADLVPPDAQPFALARSNLRLTVLGIGEAVEIHGCD